MRFHCILFERALWEIHVRRHDRRVFIGKVVTPQVFARLNTLKEVTNTIHNTKYVSGGGARILSLRGRTEDTGFSTMAFAQSII